MPQTETLGIFIAKPYELVCGFLAEPRNFPRWASGLAMGLELTEDGWVGDAPQGKVKIRFSPPNAFGIADHWVILPTGEEVYVPLRALAHGAGTEVILTLFPMPSMSEEDFAGDTAIVRRDLASLKDLLESV
ncbi:MAG TPA: hypothetical protein VGM36_14990 [Rhizomicrobium sp.]|jgi:hypothetical protein